MYTIFLKHPYWVSLHFISTYNINKCIHIAKHGPKMRKRVYGLLWLFIEKHTKTHRKDLCCPENYQNYLNPESFVQHLCRLRLQLRWLVSFNFKDYGYWMKCMERYACPYPIQKFLQERWWSIITFGRNKSDLWMPNNQILVQMTSTKKTRIYGSVH